MGSKARLKTGLRPPAEVAPSAPVPTDSGGQHSEPNHDVRGVAAALGVSVQTVYLLCAKRRLRHVRVGVGRGTIRVPESAVREYLDGATVRPEGPAGPDEIGTTRGNPSHLRPSS